MYKAYKYRIYPNSSQKSDIDQTLNVCRFIYNLALETKIRAWESAGVTLTAFDLHRQLTDAKEGHDWISAVNSQALIASINQIDKAFKGFFNGNGYPKFKNKKGRQSFQCHNNTRKIDFDNGLLTIPKIKSIPIRISRRFEGQIKTITISKTTTGKYFASILVDNKIKLPQKPVINEHATIGIDVGIKSFVVTSNGLQFEPNRKLKNNLNRLQCLQRRASRKTKGSSNQKNAYKLVAILHEKINNQRSDYIHKITTQLIRDNQVDSFVIENLAVSGMMKNRKLSQAISDVSFGMFFNALKYKCEWYGKNLIMIDRFAPSSKRCSKCGVINTSLTLADREWTCICGAIHDRDFNAANNIKWFGLNNT